MLDKHRCPHTGVVNYFYKTEPLLAVGSIVETGPGRFIWHCHVADNRGGATADRSAAESELTRAMLPGMPRQKA